MPNQRMARRAEYIDTVRRRLLKVTMGAGLAFLAPVKVFAAIQDFTSNDRSILIYNPVTDESVSTVYWYNGQYVPDALDHINYIMRDHRTNDVKPIDTGLINLLYTIKRRLSLEKPFHLVSGYRCRQSNELLRRRGRKAARNSFHLKGQAADIRLPNGRLSSLHKAAMAIKGGGVGFYPNSRFVHVDVGPIRHWSFKGK